MKLNCIFLLIALSVFPALSILSVLSFRSFLSVPATTSFAPLHLVRSDPNPEDSNNDNHYNN